MVKYVVWAVALIDMAHHGVSIVGVIVIIALVARFLALSTAPVRPWGMVVKRNVATCGVFFRLS